MRNWWWCAVSACDEPNPTPNPVDDDARRVVMPEEIGPILVQGPVEVVLEDGSVRASVRPMVALCTCRRSRSYPFCDTSHRRRSRRPDTGRDG